MASNVTAEKPKPKPQSEDAKAGSGGDDGADAQQPPRGPLMRLWLAIRPIIILVLILFAVRSSIADWNDVPTGSMIPTILEGDRIFVNKLAYDLKIPFTTIHVPGCTWSDPKRGDIVVFFSPEPSGTRLVKRVIGVPGDTIMLRNNHLFVNGVAATYAPLDPKYISTFSDAEKQRYRFAMETYDGRAHPVMEIPERYNPLRDFGPVTIPAGKYFMMGDDRDNSRDSRFFTADGAPGSPRIFVDRNDIVGRATAVAISVDLNHHWIPRWSRFFSKLP